MIDFYALGTNSKIISAFRALSSSLQMETIFAFLAPHASLITMSPLIINTPRRCIYASLQNLIDDWNKQIISSLSW